MKRIYITYDFTSIANLAHEEVEYAIYKGKEQIYTTCTSFFSFKYVDSDNPYDVIVIKQNGDYISATDLLYDTTNAYTKRNIRIGHDIEKLLLSGEFSYKKDFNERTYLK